MIANTLPKSLADNPRLDRWLGFETDGSVRVCVGKVEIGQGITTALAAIAAEELDVELGAVSMVSASTGLSPDEGTTSGSMSVEMSGASLRLVCAEARAMFTDAAAAHLGCAPASLEVIDGVFWRDGQPTTQSYASLADVVSLAQDATGAAAVKPRGKYRLVGTDIPRIELPERLAGLGFVHDLTLPGMLHARVLRQPREGATLANFRTRAGVDVLREGQFVAFLSASETEARLAVQNAAAEWEGGVALSPAMAEADWLVAQPANTRRFGPEPVAGKGARLRRGYTKPYIAHASMGPSCAVARFEAGVLTVWTHTQGVYPMRAIIARIVKLKPEQVVLHHVPGPGSYGHNGADDAAIDAAVIALRRPGVPIRVLWQREDEHGFEPMGPAMRVEIEAELDDAGMPVDWTVEFWSGQHVSRASLPATALAVRALPDPPALPVPNEPLESSPGLGVRNALPFYDIPATRYVHHLARWTPVRTSSLRGLGAVAHVCAIESFVDELAEMAGVDPVAYRLRMLADPRGRAVIEAAAAMAGWQTRGPGGTGVGLGFGFARYKNRGGYAAVVAEVAAEAEVVVRRIWCAGDAGLAINPDGVRAQLEGGIIQAISWTLKEKVTLDRDGVTSRDWASYPILRFPEVPTMEVRLLDDGMSPAVGMGEASLGPAMAAVANGAAHALGVRVRDLPLTRERIVRAMG
jgi:CO/xanthine dehydrogenase Mo-binding subunit